MRHTLKQAATGRTCTRCGRVFDEDATGEEIMGQMCDGAVTGYRSTVTWKTSREVIDAFFDKHMSKALRNQPYEDAETRGRRLVKSAGYMNDDEEGL